MPVFPHLIPKFPPLSAASSGRAVFGLLFLLGALAVSPSPGAAEPVAGDIVVLRALDKVTARTKDLFVPIDETARFGSLAIQPRKCLKQPPEETPETSAFLEITEVNEGVPPVPLFSGWMFASSPAINALEHPVYDVWVIDCRISTPPAPSGKE